MHYWLGRERSMVRKGFTLVVPLFGRIFLLKRCFSKLLVGNMLFVWGTNLNFILICFWNMFIKVYLQNSWSLIFRISNQNNLRAPRSLIFALTGCWSSCCGLNPLSAWVTFLWLLCYTCLWQRGFPDNDSLWSVTCNLVGKVLCEKEVSWEAFVLSCDVVIFFFLVTFMEYKWGHLGSNRATNNVNTSTL